MCVEAAVCYALSQQHATNQLDVHPPARPMINLSDSLLGPDDRAQTKGLRRVAIAQLGTADTLDGEQFKPEFQVAAIQRCARSCSGRRHMRGRQDDKQAEQIESVAAQCEAVPIAEAVAAIKRANAYTSATLARRLRQCCASACTPTPTLTPTPTPNANANAPTPRLRLHAYAYAGASRPTPMPRANACPGQIPAGHYASVEASVARQQIPAGRGIALLDQLCQSAHERHHALHSRTAAWTRSPSASADDAPANLRRQIVVAQANGTHACGDRW